MDNYKRGNNPAENVDRDLLDKAQELRNQIDFEVKQHDKYFMQNYRVSGLRGEITELGNKITKMDIDIKNLKKNGNYIDKKYEVTNLNVPEQQMIVNFASKGNPSIGSYSLPCKNTDLFIRLEEKLYQDFPQFKQYFTHFTANGKTIKRFQTLYENEIKDNDLINLLIDSE